ncbi:acyl-CoA dehydrogenase family protein [Thermoactinospora rubra]|uniref:acyl-CoA dehydrogenase family protein n=1 Tax=Thermoactinospora rubra TaxID=1088767 RepID=UPI000A10D464|nr:acyl-CoA dehydrogenase family protein [Thermoactinospora rubra]
MNLLLSQEQRDLRAAVRSFLDGNSRPREGYDPAVYRRLGGELGLSGLIVPEEYGGAGAGYAELAVVLEETGAALLPGPFLATVFATIALTRVPDKELLTAIAEGRLVATVAQPPRDEDVRLEGDRIAGTLGRVLGGMEADVLVVPAASGDEIVMAAVELDDPGVSRTELATLDITRGQAGVRLDGARARVLGPRPREGILDRMCVALAAEQLGVMRAALEAIVAYAKVRAAFGRLIGSYQGVKFKLADMHCQVEQAESIVRYAAWAADESPGELPKAAALAQAYVGRACFEVARDHLLLHGGIGFTWEHDAHLYYKRAKADEVMLGPPRVHRTRLADLLEL